MPVHEFLEPVAQTAIPVYANINRATTDRSPEGCAASARNAVTQGYRRIKIAPFDGVCSDDFAADWAAQRARIDAGIARVFAIRDAIGPEIELMVDCHWRFDEPTALAVLESWAREAVLVRVLISGHPSAGTPAARFAAARHARLCLLRVPRCRSASAALRCCSSAACSMS